MRIAFFGTSEFVGSLQNARFLRRLVAAGVKPAVVVTAPDAHGRDGRGGLGAVKSAALAFGLPVLQPSALPGFSEELRKYEIGLSLVVAYGKILPPDVLEVPKFGSLNIHPSLLPRWRGTTPIQSVILAGDTMTGVTIIQMDSEMDHGPIVANSKFEILNSKITAPELSDALTDLGVELFFEVLEPWVGGTITPRPQDHAAATYSRILKKEDGHIDWAIPAYDIERQIRAFKPWPGAYTFWQRNGDAVRLNVEAAESRRTKDEGRAAGVVFAEGGSVLVETSEGAIIVQQLKPEGGKSMSGADFIRGHPAVQGAMLK